MSEAENATRRSLIRMTWQTLYAFPVFDTLFILSKHISVCMLDGVSMDYKRG
jgi:hypothetical protein